MQRESSDGTRGWICWGGIAVSTIVIVATCHIQLARFEQKLIDLFGALPSDPTPPSKPIWLAAVSFSVLALLAAACLTRRGRAQLRMRPQLSRPSAHGNTYLEAVALATAIMATGSVAMFAGCTWGILTYSGRLGVAVAVIYAIWRCRSIRVPLAEWGWRSDRALWREVGIGVVAGIALRSIRVLPGALFDSTNPDPEVLRAVTLGALGSIVLAPIAEETLYRGMLYRHLRDRLTWPIAVLFSAAVFACSHTPVSRWPLVFVAGVMFALLRERRGSLVAPLAAHATGNLLAILIPAVLV